MLSKIIALFLKFYILFCTCAPIHSERSVSEQSWIGTEWSKGYSFLESFLAWCSSASGSSLLLTAYLSPISPFGTVALIYGVIPRSSQRCARTSPWKFRSHDIGANRPTRLCRSWRRSGLSQSTRRPSNGWSWTRNRTKRHRLARDQICFLIMTWTRSSQERSCCKRSIGHLCSPCFGRVCDESSHESGSCPGTWRGSDRLECHRCAARTRTVRRIFDVRRWMPCPSLGRGIWTILFHPDRSSARAR